MELDPIDIENQRVELIWTFAKRLALVCTILAALPTLIGWMSGPPGSLYLGIQTNLDDHMVYAAWMRQAMDGHFLFDNRFAVDQQPTLTVHLYFFALGLLAKVTGIPAAMALGRLALTYLFVLSFGRLLAKLGMEVFAAKYMLLIGSFGGGVGFLVWEKFGQAYTNGPAVLSPLFDGLLPIDVWQPEAFVFPSMLTNGLFMASLCLILAVFQAVLDSRESWKPVLKGALAFGLLMNIHSYDALLVGLVLVAFLGTQIVQKRFSWPWLGRALCIAAGAVPPALWIAYVLANDPVFQARAATITYSPAVRQVVFGILPPLALALYAAWTSEGRYRLPGFLALLALLGGLLALSSGRDTSSYLLGPAAWAVAFGVALLAVALLSDKEDTWNLAWSWAVAGFAAVYFPAVFQRKLAMGLVLPWSLLAAYGLTRLLKPLERSTRNLVATLSLVIMGASGLAWFLRENVFIRTNVSSTTVHTVYQSEDASKIIAYLNQVPGRKVALSMPGVPNPVGPADYRTPLIADLNPVISGLTGAYTFSGHWSETPDYNRRRGMATKVFLASTSPEERSALLGEIRPDFIVAPNTLAFPVIELGDQRYPLADLSGLGETVYSGNQLLLIKVARP